ncbi:DUF6969 family protein [Allopontixanthobacter sp.]|uniref:DUF6969 family protein n=1 Tax=Allopontixanthobacter sp. TaxID=2906452 RepID=UPI002AB85286|nr:hypothetical protein [Allopontixanthobacter sp.]MDZ4307032.1 hypothetical protein [Allopontixanthobacter sp.]
MSMEPLDAAHVVIDAITEMAREGRPLMTRILPPSDIHWWEHYPDDDARDARTRSRWYYHVHAPGDRDPAEHGHFHLFLHRTQMDDGSLPVAAPAEGEEALAFVTHIAGLAIDHHGIPVNWFATNRWVTNEFMYPAPVMIDHLDRYDVDQTEEDKTVNRFLTAMVALYRQEIGDMLLERDRRIAGLTSAGADPEDIFEVGNDVLAICPIDLDAKIEELGIE